MHFMEVGGLAGAKAAAHPRHSRVAETPLFHGEAVLLTSNLPKDKSQ